MFRGINQEPGDSKLTLFPYGDLGIAFYSGEGAIKSASVNFGVWNALLTGTSGLDGRRTSCTTRRTSTPRSRLGSTRDSRSRRPTRPTRARTDVQHRSGDFVQGFEFSHARAVWTHRFRTRGSSRCGAGQGHVPRARRGAQLATGRWESDACGAHEAGAQPQRLLRRSRRGFDVRVLPGRRSLQLPLSGATSKFGAWNLHGGVDFYALGDTTKAFNNGDGGKVVASIGIGVVYSIARIGWWTASAPGRFGRSCQSANGSA